MTIPAVQRLDLTIADALLEISNAVGSVMEIDEILATICDIGVRVMRTKTCSIYLLDEEVKAESGRRELVLRATTGLRKELINKGRFLYGQGVPGWAAEHNEVAVVNDATNDPRYLQLDDSQKEYFLAYLCTPLRIQEEVIGVLSIRREHPTEWTDEEVAFAEIVAKQVAIVLEKVRLYRQKLAADRLAAIAISLSEVAHYIKNLLQGMSGGAYFIETGLKRGDFEKTLTGWELLKRNQEKIAALVQNMLNYAREQRLELKAGDLNELLYGIARDIEETAFRRNVVLSVQLDDNVPEVLFDHDALHDAVLNLVGNAMDAIKLDRKGEVQITSRFDPARRVVRLGVSDNGAGIPPESRSKIFNLFFSTKGKQGTGIGLSVTKKLVEEHGGRIWFESEVGKGTTFFIELPVA